MCRRTLALSNLPDNATHKDITSIVRGGMLLDIFLRAAERVVLVSFLREEDAVFVKWGERHFHLAGHVAGKIGLGATRNLIIRRCDPKHTVDSIREDLDHIHNLIVIDVEFVGGSCYIKTNSVHNAMFARTCMMSRAKYKGSKIEWDVDECEQPIEVAQRAPAKPQPASAPKKTQANMRNRFATLRLDDDDDETDDKFDTSSEFRSPSTVNVTA
ncbi:putative rna recognition motif containing protein [Eutypa lata UCREL1]|uniref:Putative rna recognition motif containing protein n=1 Tax=Eutypa lata (strain UCR-EL1) TaxID=1287681 RepID=M7SVG5_EUTLA|nr:putative rna recognition motif containing protein [Eutypa lata UCREL1]